VEIRLLVVGIMGFNEEEAIVIAPWPPKISCHPWSIVYRRCLLALRG